MHRRAVLTCACAALVGCSLAGCNTPADRDGAPATWVYPPSIAAWPIGVVTGGVGRSQAPQLADQLGVVGSVTVPLRLATPWAVPGEGPARAILYGTAGDAPAVELIDIDAGRIVWRDTTQCAAPVVGVTDEVVVCADAKGTRAIGLDGKRRWGSEATFIAMTAERVVTAGSGEAVILDATIGDELARVKLPAAPRIAAPVVSPRARPAVPPPGPAPPISSESIIASCGDAGRELFAYGQDGLLIRIAEGPGGPKVSWTVPLPMVAAIDACDGATVLVTTAGAAGTQLVALARDTGKQTGVLDGVRGFWPARDGSARLEVSTNAGVAIHARDLAGAPEPTSLPALAELLAQRGELRLVRATKHSAALLDARGVRAYFALAGLGAVLGDKAVIAASWLGSPGESVHRFALPQRYRRALRVPTERPPLAVPAELRDLPATIALDVGAAVAKVDTGKGGIGPIALDPAVPAVYAATVEPETVNAGVARFDLATRSWAWFRGDGCGTGTPIALAVGRELIVCGSRDPKGAKVTITTRDGVGRGYWAPSNVDALQAAGNIVLVHDGDTLDIIDFRDNRHFATYRSDDGAPMRAAALDVDGMEMVVVYQRGLLMALLPRVQMVPAWTLAVRGVVSAILPAGEGVLVALEDGDAYRVDARTGAVVAIPGLDLVWGTSGDLVTGQAPGGPVPPAMPPAAAPLAAAKKAPIRRGPAPPPRDPTVDPPVLPKPWPAPPSMQASWQYTLYELSGALRARNDYAVEAPTTPAPRGPGDSPLVVQYGPGLRELLVVEPRRGDPVRRIHLPDDAAPGTAFATIVDGKPVVGTLLVNPLRAVLFY